MLCGCGITLLGHVFLLQRSKLDWVSSSIGELSLHNQANVHGLVLLSFAFSQASVALKVNHDGAGLFTRCIQAFSVLNAFLLASLGYIFTIDKPVLHTIFLCVIASNTGIMMCQLVVRDISKNRQAASTIINGVLLVIWLILIPAFLITQMLFLWAPINE